MGHEGEVNSLSFSPDGKTLGTAADDKIIMLWDVAKGEEIDTLEGHQDWVNDVAFNPDGKTLASASEDGTVRVWEVGK
jgi:WD40 repeat protein